MIVYTGLTTVGPLVMYTRREQTDLQRIVFPVPINIDLPTPLICTINLREEDNLSIQMSKLLVGPNLSVNWRSTALDQYIM